MSRSRADRPSARRWADGRRSRRRHSAEPRYVIAAVAARSGVQVQTSAATKSTVWSRRRRCGPGPRLYSEADVGRVRRIQRLVDDLGVNLAGAAAILHLREQLVGLQRELIACGSTGRRDRDASGHRLVHERRVGYSQPRRESPPVSVPSRHQHATDGTGDATMPATIVMGGQWGDEGKGKLTDCLAAARGRRRPRQRRHQRRPHRRDRARRLQAASGALRHPQPGLRLRHRRRRRRSTRRRCSRRWTSCGRAASTCATCGSPTAPTSSCPTTRCSTAGRDAPRRGRRSARRCAATARPTPTRWPAAASASATCSTRRRCCAS